MTKYSPITQSAVPDAPPPPTALAIGDQEVELQWQAPASDGGSRITAYRLELRATRGAARWRPGAELPIDELRKGLKASLKGELIATGETYEFRVIACNRAGPGKPSGPSNATTVKMREAASEKGTVCMIVIVVAPCQ